MHVAFLTSSLGGGGAQYVATTLANEFSKRGVRTDMVCGIAEGANEDRVHDAVRVVDLGQKRLSRALRPLVRYLASERPDVLISFMMDSNLLAVAARSISRSRAKSILSERTVATAAMREVGRPLRNVATRVAMRVLYPLADEIVAVSQGVADDLVTNIGIRRPVPKVIHNPTVSPEFFASSRGGPPHPWLERPNLPVVLAVGRLAPAKDYPTLLRAFKTATERVRARMIILGDGPLRADLEREAAHLDLAGVVEFAGHVADPGRWMRYATVYVLSSRREGLPNTLIQAVALGTPAISTDCPAGPSDILEGGKWGTLVPVGDAAALGEAIAAAVRSPSTPEAASERAVRRFGVDAISEAYLRLCIDVTS